jgi:hypothetical protein
VIPIPVDSWRPLEVGERIAVAEGKKAIGDPVVTSTEHMPP